MGPRRCFTNRGSAIAHIIKLRPSGRAASSFWMNGGTDLNEAGKEAFAWNETD